MSDQQDLQELAELEELERLEALEAAANAQSPGLMQRIFMPTNGTPGLTESLLGPGRRVGAAILGEGPFRSVEQGFTLGLEDEANALVKPNVVSALGSALFGEGSLADVGNAYSLNVDAQRGDFESFQANHPIVSGALEMAGSLPAGMSLGVGKAKTLAGSALRASGAGMVEGGLSSYGRGEGDAGSRLSNALIGTVLGGIGGGVLGAAGDAVPAGMAWATKRAQELRGKLPRLEGAEKVIENLTRSAPAQYLKRGLGMLDEAHAAGQPLTPTEAVPSLGRYGQTLASHPASADQVTEFLKGRAANARQRISGFLDETVTPATSIDEDAAALRMAAQGKIDAEKAGLYGPNGEDGLGEEVFNWAIREQPKVDPRGLEMVTPYADDKAVKRAVDSLDDWREFRNLPEDSSQRMHQVKKNLNSQREAARTQPDRMQDVGLLSERIDTYKNALREGGDAYGLADEFYSAYKGVIEGLEEGPVGQIAGQVNEGNIHAVSKLLKFTPEQIKELKGRLGPEQQQSLLRGTRAAIDNVIENTRDGHSYFAKVYKTEGGRRKLEALLGKEKADSLGKYFQREGMMQEGRIESLGGSQTQPRQVSAGLIKRALGKIGVSGLAETNLYPRGEAREMQDLAATFFDPGEKGKQALTRALMYREGAEPIETFWEQGRPLSSAVGVSLADALLNGLTRDRRKPQ